MFELTRYVTIQSMFGRNKQGTIECAFMRQIVRVPHSASSGQINWEPGGRKLVTQFFFIHSALLSDLLIPVAIKSSYRRIELAFQFNFVERKTIYVNKSSCTPGRVCV